MATFFFYMAIFTGIMHIIPVMEKSEKINSFLDFIFGEV